MNFNEKIDARIAYLKTIWHEDKDPKYYSKPDCDDMRWKRDGIIRELENLKNPNYDPTGSFY